MVLRIVGLYFKGEIEHGGFGEAILLFVVNEKLDFLSLTYLEVSNRHYRRRVAFFVPEEGRPYR